MILQNFRAVYDKWSFQRFHELQLFRTEGTEITYIKDIILTTETPKDMEVATPNPLVTDQGTMQSIFDALYRGGFRPSRPFKDETDAQKRHLNDMRKLIERAHGIKLAED